jgi:hypothetical protein
MTGHEDRVTSVVWVADSEDAHLPSADGTPRLDSRLPSTQNISLPFSASQFFQTVRPSWQDAPALFADARSRDAVPQNTAKAARTSFVGLLTAQFVQSALPARIWKSWTFPQEDISPPLVPPQVLRAFRFGLYHFTLLYGL